LLHRIVDVLSARCPRQQARPLAQLRADICVVKSEPARPRGRCSSGVDGDHFEISTRAELENAIVCAHRDVPAAGLRLSAQYCFDKSRALLQRVRADDQVIKFANRPHLQRQPFNPATI